MSFDTKNTMPVEIKELRHTGGYHTEPTINDISSVTTYEEAAPGLGVFCTRMNDSAMTSFNNGTSNKNAHLSATSSPITEDTAMLDMASDAMSSTGMGMEENQLKTDIRSAGFETNLECEDGQNKVGQMRGTKCIQELGAKLTHFLVIKGAAG